MEKIKVLLADDDRAMVERLASELKGQEGIEVVATAENGMEALRLLRLFPVDVLVLDLVMSKLDGFGVLKELRSFEKKPKVLTLSSVTREDLITRALNLGSDYYMLKPFDPENVYQRILELMHPVEPITELMSRRTGEDATLDERIADIFLSMGIPAHIKGYHFLREAIKLVVSDRDKINAITKDLYPSVAIHFSTTSSKVERAIRHAIDVAWNRGQMENLNMLFGSRFGVRRDKPTNGEFIALIADRLSIQKSA